SKIMTFNKNDIDTIEKAKEYPDYHGGKLTDQEKEIFNSDLLTPNGTLDVSLLQDTAELLNDCKKAETNLKVERSADVLSNDGNKLLVSLMAERRNNSIAYQLVNEKDENEEGRVDKMVKEYQTVLFQKNNKTLDLKLKEALISFAKVSKEEEKVAKEITELEKKYNPQVLQEQTDLENKVDTAVTALKDDLRIVNTGGRKFLEFIIENGKNFSELNYKSDVPATTEHYGSIIKTGYNGNNKPYTHPLYLNCAWDAGDKKKFKGADASIIGKKYVDNSTNVLKAPFDVEEKHLTWANVYNSDEAVEFNAYDEVISKDGIMDERIREEEITIYEKKLTCSSSIFNRHIAKKNYTLYVEKFISNLLDATGKKLFEEEEVVKKAMDTLVKFREEAKGLSFDELKVRIGLESIRAELGKKRSELTKISLQKADKKQKLIQIQNQIKDFETNQINHLRTQLKNLGDKLTNPSDENIITYQETIAIRTLIYFLTDLEKEGKLETLLTTTEKGYLTKVEHELNNAQQTIGLKSREETELLAIQQYLTNPELRSENLHELELKKIADILLNLEDKTTFFNELKEYLKDKQGVPIFPADTADDYQKTDYFFTLPPQHVITFSTTYHIKHDSVKKKEIETEMKADRNPADKTKTLDWNIYGDGTSPTEAGTKKYYFEKLAGINHSYAKQKATESQPTSKEGF
ncbi:7486_t:CDS:2, partial [Entrophospora sp. SA101]